MLSNALLPINFQLYDDFYAKSSQPGYIERPICGGIEYTLRGWDLLSPSVSCVVNNRWTTTDYKTCYLINQLPDNAKSIGAKIRWENGTGFNDDAVFVLITSVMGYENVAWICTHTRFTRSGLSFDVRYHNKTVYSKDIFFPEQLKMYKEYIIDINFEPNIARINIEGVISELIYSNLIDASNGPFVCYELAYHQLPTTNVSVGSLWAGS